MLVTRDRTLAEGAALLRNQAFTAERFVHRHVGFNYRMTNIQAAIGLAQCERFEEKLRRKRELAGVYNELLGGEPSIQRPVEVSECQNVYWMYGVVLKESFGVDRETVRERLDTQGVETRSFFVPMHRQPIYDGHHPRWPDLRGSFPVSEALGMCGFYLPSGMNLSRDEKEYVVEQLLSCKR